ncbi:hypothetical protein V8G54_034970 [Vigna mungo]|uniref:Uncharacterized protein n=1 Tax=Vigna mungo TaxID=3915 RepID=A0AAQ3RCI2_VIGMU
MCLHYFMILMPRGSNHAQATTEDLCLLHALKENIQTDRAVAISKNMLKTTRLESASLSYSVFISKVLLHFGVECMNESCESYGKNNLIEKIALYHMGLQHGQDGWLFKDEYAAEEEEVVGSSSTPFRPRFEFEKHMVRQMHSLTILCQSINQDVVAIKGKMQIDEYDGDSEENEQEEEDEEESEADESDDDILVRDII